MSKFLSFLFAMLAIVATVFAWEKYSSAIPNIFDRIGEEIIGPEGIAEYAVPDFPAALDKITGGGCRLPITYSIGSVDPGFGVSKEAVVSAAFAAEKLWETSAGKNIFEYAADGIPVNLVYDERQIETDRLKNKLTNLETSRERYDLLIAEYEALSSEITTAATAFESLKSSYESASASFSDRASAFEIDKATYEKEIAEWNAKGGAPEEVYTRLAAESKSLKDRAMELNTELEGIRKIYSSLEAARDSLNNLIGRANAAAALVNSIAASLNERVIEYNHFAGGREEFITGFYRSSPVGKKIEVFQFGSANELALIIAHELGHAAGIGHAEEERSIMYPKTIIGLSRASAEDISLLEASCR